LRRPQLARARLTFPFGAQAPGFSQGPARLPFLLCGVRIRTGKVL